MPKRDTVAFPSLVQTGNWGAKARLAYKPVPRNIRYFSRTPYARRAINAIKNPISMLEWEIRPIVGNEMNSELERQAEIATFVISHPNIDDSSRTLFEQVMEDVLCGGGAIEMQPSGDPERPVWMWPVDGLTIQVYPGWTGQKDEARYVQVVGYGNFLGYGGGSQIPLRNDELIYLRPNPSSGTPFGVGPLEIAFNSVARLLGVGEFAGNVATNSRPSIGLDLGEGFDGSKIAAFRDYWRNEVEGQGNMPIFGLEGIGGDGKARGASVIRFYPEGDAGLYLQWQNFLKREIATAFDLSPMVLGVERDVNRSTAEVGEDRDRDSAIKPYAHLLATHLTRDLLHANMGFHSLRFHFLGLDNEDEMENASVFEKEYKNNAITPNEYRYHRGMPPLNSEWGDQTNADFQIAMMAARGAAQIEDDDLVDKNKKATAPKPKVGTPGTPGKPAKPENRNSGG